MDLFGTSSAPWKTSLWHAVDDRVRGGASTSALDLVSKDDPIVARFHGHLDISTLGGAGFASQVYDIPPSLSASHYKGISLQTLAVSKSSIDMEKAQSPRPKEFVLTLKTQAPERRPDGRLESRLSFEYHFVPSFTSSQTHTALWSDFVPTYRGRRTNGQLDPSKLTEIGLMCRSNFGAQEGDFELRLGRVNLLGEDRTWWNSLSWWMDWVVGWYRYWVPAKIQLS